MQAHFPSAPIQRELQTHGAANLDLDKGSSQAHKHTISEESNSYVLFYLNVK